MDAISKTLVKRRDEYLSDAAYAEQRALQSNDPQIQQSWRTIADSYRDLAARAAQSIKQNAP